MAQHGLMEKAPGICSDAITRIPMIWRWPGKISKDIKITEIVEAVDLCNTFCSLANIDEMETSDGKDMTPLLKGGHNPIHKIGVTEFAWTKSVRKGKYRLVSYHTEMSPEEYPEGFGELYDLEKDPWEMQNLFFKEKYKELVWEMERDLFDWLRETTRVKSCAPMVRLEAGKENQNLMRWRVMTNKDMKINPRIFRQFDNINYL